MTLLHVIDLCKYHLLRESPCKAIGDLTEKLFRIVLGFDAFKISVSASLFMSGCFSYSNGIKQVLSKMKLCHKKLGIPLLILLFFCTGDHHLLEHTAKYTPSIIHRVWFISIDHYQWRTDRPIYHFWGDIFITNNRMVVVPTTTYTALELHTYLASTTEIHGT